nr:Rho termination factor N-terminal domain-containing protein [Acholeplasma granularum]
MANAVIEANGGVVEKYEDEEVSFEQEKDSRPNQKPRQPRQDQNRQPRQEFKKEFKKEAPVVKEAQEVAPTTEEVSTEDLSTLKVQDLRDLAKAKGIENYSKLKKQELIDALNE